MVQHSEVSDPKPAAVRAWLAGRQEADWLLDLRRQALGAYERAELPYWDRTEIRPFASERFAAPVAGEVGLSPLPEAAARRGVVFCDLAAAARQHADLLRPHLGRLLPADRGKFEALHLAAAGAGVLLYVPDGVELEEPLEVTLTATDPGAIYAPHTLVVLGRGASASLFTRYTGVPGGFALPAVEAIVADAARLQCVSLQNLDATAIAFVARRGELGRDARLEWVLGDFGGRSVRAYTESVLRGVGGEARSTLVFFGDGRQHLDLALSMVHYGAHTIANMVTKGVLKDEARAVYRGASDIKAGSKESNSQQSAKTLHLSDRVRSDSIPALYIDEYQLSAGHAATVGKVDEEQLFYLKSRGLPEIEALRLIVHGFFAPLLEGIPLAGAREELAALIDRKLGGTA